MRMRRRPRELTTKDTKPHEGILLDRRAFGDSFLNGLQQFVVAFSCAAAAKNFAVTADFAAEVDPFAA